MIAQHAPRNKTHTIRRALSATAICLFATTAAAQTAPGLNTYGVPGLIDTPTAHSMRDADLATTLAVTGDAFRGTLSFQIAPRLLGSFRYAAIREFDNEKSIDGVFYDRSFDLRYQLLTETERRPGVVIGLQDFMGTGLLESEYIVASKTVAPGLTLSGGLGWGRLGSANSIGSGGERSTELLSEGGIPNADRWFRGDVGVFGGVSYSPTDRLTLKLEYSSDNYDTERLAADFDGTSQWNYGVDYRFRNGGQVSLYHMYGNTVGFQYSIVSNPRRSQLPSGLEGAALPVGVRAPGSAADLGWTTETRDYRTTLSNLMAQDGLILEGMNLNATSATVRVRNQRYHEVPQAIGRAARAMSRVLPASVESFTILPTNGHVPLSAVTLRRSDLETLEFRPADEILARTSVTDAAGLSPQVYDDIYPRFTWGLSPQVKLSAFDPESPIRASLGLKLGASYQPTPNLLFSGALTSRLTGNLQDIEDTENDSDLPEVRTDFREYAARSELALESLTVNHFGRPGKDLYSRVTLGYLETMYGGLSAELLWKPVDSRLALGAEVNLVKKRDYDQGFGFRDYETATGHLSAYYDFGKGYMGRVDVGRYLAGDVGATLALDREFGNGWRIGAYATLTDVEPEDFGEGSFDKGIRITIPTSQIVGKPSKSLNEFNIRSLTRDGGARVNVQNRLYDKVRRGHEPELVRSWGRFWR